MLSGNSGAAFSLNFALRWADLPVIENFSRNRQSGATMGGPPMQPTSFSEYLANVHPEVYLTVFAMTLATIATIATIATLIIRRRPLPNSLPSAVFLREILEPIDLRLFRRKKCLDRTIYCADAKARVGVNRNASDNRPFVLGSVKEL
jgi:hypothetical protein